MKKQHVVIMGDENSQSVSLEDGTIIPTHSATLRLEAGKIPMADISVVVRKIEVKADVESVFVWFDGVEYTIDGFISMVAEMLNMKYTDFLHNYLGAS